jgi:hypothetical protein
VHQQLIGLLDTQQQLEAGGELWRQVNVAQRDTLLALGYSIQDVEATWERFKDAAKDPAAAAEMEAFWSEKFAAVRAELDETGITLTELRNKVQSEMKAAAESASRSLSSIGGGGFRFEYDDTSPKIPHLQHGGIVTAPTLAMVGEAGPEAVVPLSQTGGGKYRADLHFAGGTPTQAAAFRGLAPLLEGAKVDIKLLRRG